MVHAFIMVRTGPGTGQEVRSVVDDIETVVDAHVVAGEFDLIAESEGSEVYDVLSTASSDIQAIDGVLETKTYMSLSS